MIICPNCHNDLIETKENCLDCGWLLKKNQGILNYLSNSDLENKLFLDYFENYQKLSMVDFQQSIVDNNYSIIQAKKLVNYLGSGEIKSVLEVGVGKGFFIKEFKKKKKSSKITAVDISIEYLQNIKSTLGVECLLANAENLPFKEEFDVVVASDIMEHVLSPIDFLLSANMSLKPGGLLLLRVPFEENMLQYSRLLGAKYKFAHLRNFSKRNLTLILQQAGYQIKNIHYDGYSIHQVRNLFNMKEKIVEILQKFYSEESYINQIPNWIGRILMKPLEVAVLVKKKKFPNSMNDLF